LFKSIQQTIYSKRSFSTVRRSQGIINGPGWKEKVKAEVREQEEKRLRDAEGYLSRDESTVENHNLKKKGIN
jgi:hypothetical protein